MRSRTTWARWRVVGMWLAAIGFGAIGVTGTRSYIHESLDAEKARLARSQQTVAVVVAKRDVAAGARINTDTMALRQMPRAYLPPTAVLAGEFDEVAGKQLHTPVAAGQALVSTAIGEPAPGLSHQVGHGIRAMTIAVDEINSVSGMLSPGDRIDLLFSTRPPNTGTQVGRDITAPLMQDLLVLATGQRTERGAAPAWRHAGRATDQPARFSTITVEVTPDQAQRLVLAQRSGRLTALLRNPQDRHEQAARPMDVYTLLGITPPGAPTHSPPSTEIIVGGLGPIGAAAATGSEAGTP